MATPQAGSSEVTPPAPTAPAAATARSDAADDTAASSTAANSSSEIRDAPKNPDLFDLVSMLRDQISDSSYVQERTEQARLMLASDNAQLAGGSEPLASLIHAMRDAASNEGRVECSSGAES